MGYQTNLMIYEAGDLRFRDFLVHGAPLTLLVGTVCALVIPWLWPL